MRNYRIGIIFLVLFFACPQIIAQETADARYFKYLVSQTENYFLQNTDSAEYYLDKSIDYSHNFSEPYYKSYVFQLNSRKSMLETDLVSALLSQKMAIDILVDYPDSTEYIDAERKLGDIFLEMDDFLRALIQYRKVIQIAEDHMSVYGHEHEDQANLIRAQSYAKIALIYDELGDYESELLNLKKSTKIGYMINSKESEKLKVVNLINLGYVYYRMGDFERAEEYTIKNLEEKKRFGIKYSEGQNYQVLGLIAIGRKKYKLAESYFSLSDKKLEEFNIKRELLRNQFYRGKIYYGSKDYKRAISILEEIKDEYLADFSDHENHEYYALLSEVYAANGDELKSYYASRRAQGFQKGKILTTDSEVVDEFMNFIELSSDKSNVKLEDLKANQELEKVNLEIKNRSEKKSWVILFFVCTISGLLLVISVMLFVYKKNIKSTQNLREIEEENQILFKEVHHRVKNNFQIISSMLNLQKGMECDDDSGDALTLAQSRIQSMALVHNLLYKESVDGKLDFKEYVKELSMLILGHSNSEDKKIAIGIEGITEKIDLEIAIPLGLILNEMISNSLEHAFIGRVEGKITVSLNRLGFQEYVLRVSDNGVGQGIEIDNEENIKDSMGLFLINILVQQLDGEMEVKHNNGTEFVVKFNLLGNKT